MQSEIVLSVKNATKCYRNFMLNNVSFDLHLGEVIGLVGNNGSGKTTLIKAIVNAIYLTDGVIEVFGKKSEDYATDIKQYIGFVNDDFKISENLTVKNVANIFKQFYTHWDEQHFSQLMIDFKLDEKKKIKHLSKGMRMKLNLAIALSHNALFYIMDEPTSGLDPDIREDIIDILLEEKSKGKSILITSHITSDIEKLADRIVLLNNGKMIVDDSTDAIANRYDLIEYTTGTHLSNIFGIKRLNDKKSRALLEKEESVDIELFKREDATLEDVVIGLIREHTDVLQGEIV